MIKRALHTWDARLISFINKTSLPLARLSLFVVYFWFGILKLFDASPASPLVSGLLEQTLPFISFEHFIIIFAIYEMVIGIGFLISGWERLAVALLIPHLISTALPLLLLPQFTWQGFLVPTLEGQYIIKNLLIIALAFILAARLKPWAKQDKASL